MNDLMIACPCNSEKKYTECCEPVIQKGSAVTALALMRSRYTSYFYGFAEYLYKTTHLSTRGQFEVGEIEKWSKENNWTNLEIVNVEHGEAYDTKGIVEFKAFYKDQNGVNHVHHEKSSFLKEDGKWFYVDGVTNPPITSSDFKVSRNSLCPCGSGKKYKRCCGK